MTKAFTLAEVLVTLGIIGVISAMTLPTLVKNHQRQVYVTQAHKFYNDMSQALELYINDRQAVNLRETPLAGSAVNLKKFFNDYFKVVKDCGIRYSPCFADEYKNMNGTRVVYTKNVSCNVIVTLASGAAVCADAQETEGFEDENGDHVGGGGPGGLSLVTIEFDVNGAQGPNIYGRDYFDFQIDTNGNIWHLRKSEHEDGVDYSSIFGFLGKIIEDGWKMNY